MTINPFEIEGRWTKAWKLVLACQAHGLDAGQAADWDDDQWALVARIAGVHPPSEKTRNLTVNLLTESQP